MVFGGKMSNSLKVPSQRSSDLLHCDIVVFVVSPPDAKSGFRPRGLQTHSGTTETVSTSLGKCTQSSVCSVVAKPMIPYWEIQGANCTVGPPSCEDLCERTLTSSTPRAENPTRDRFGTTLGIILGSLFGPLLDHFRVHFWITFSVFSCFITFSAFLRFSQKNVSTAYWIIFRSTKSDQIDGF